MKKTHRFRLPHRIINGRLLIYHIRCADSSGDKRRSNQEARRGFPRRCKPRFVRVRPNVTAEVPVSRPALGFKVKPLQNVPLRRSVHLLPCVGSSGPVMRPNDRLSPHLKKAYPIEKIKSLLSTKLCFAQSCGSITLPGSTLQLLDDRHVGLPKFDHRYDACA